MRQANVISTAAYLFVITYTVLPLFAQAPPTIDQALQAKGIQLTETALRAALQDPRIEVRGLAAGALAERHDAQAIPEIHNRLTKATNPNERLNLAQALVELGDSEGASTMVAMCTDVKTPESLSLLVASRLAEAGNVTCSPAVARILSVTSNSSMRQGALEYLKQNRSLPPASLPDLESD